MKLRSIYPFILVPLIGIVMIATVLWSVVSTFTHATPVPGRVPIPSTIGKYTSNSKMLARTAANQPLSLAIGLNLRNQADLASYIKQITTPQSPLYHHYLNAATFAALYAPLPSREAPVIDISVPRVLPSPQRILITCSLTRTVPLRRLSKPSRYRSITIKRNLANISLPMPPLHRCLSR